MKSRILIIDDEPMGVEMLKLMLENEYKVYVESGGREALKAISRIKPDLILLDIIMPEMNGFEVFRAIRGLPNFNDTPILFITAMGESGFQSEGLEMGACDYIAKPFDPNLVRLRVRNHLITHHQRLALAERSIELEHLNNKLIAENKMRLEMQDWNEQIIQELHDAVVKVKTLSGLIPICASCKKIRDDKGFWNQIESYLSKHSDMLFSHSICQDCVRKLYPDYVAKLLPEAVETS